MANELIEAAALANLQASGLVLVHQGPDGKDHFVLSQDGWKLVVDMEDASQ